MKQQLLPCGRPKCERPPPPEDKLEQWQERLRSYLTLSDLKYTEQRWQIARGILQTGGHLDAMEILDHVRRNFHGIGSATVYRTLKLLCDAGLLIHSFENLNGRVIYELADSEHHDHLICLDCGEVFEFHEEAIEALQNKVAKKMRFSPEHHQHVIHAHCSYRQENSGKGA